MTAAHTPGPWFARKDPNSLDNDDWCVGTGPENIDKAAQYVSNCDRKDGSELIESLLARWKAGRADIPAHYNPDLRTPSDA